MTTSWSRLSVPVLSNTVLTFLHKFQHLCGNIFKNNDEDVMWCHNSSAVYRRHWLCEQGRNKPSIFIWKCGKIDYMQYDNAVLPVLREEPGWCSWFSCWLQAEWSGDQIPVGGNIFHANQTSPKAHTPSVQPVASLSNELKWPQCGADRPPSLSTGCMGQRYTTTSPLCLPTDVMKWPSILPQM